MNEGAMSMSKMTSQNTITSCHKQARKKHSFLAFDQALLVYFIYTVNYNLYSILLHHIQKLESTIDSTNKREIFTNFSSDVTRI